MEYTLKHVSGPATEPVSLAEAKAHLLIEDLTLTSAQTADLESKIRAARREAEGYLGRKIGVQVWDILIDSFPWFTFWRIPLEPLISVDSIVYLDADGDEVTVPAETFGHSADKGLLWLVEGQTWPTEYYYPFAGIRVRVTVGIQPESDGASPATLRYPDNIRQAILVRLGTLYSIREDQTLGTTMQAGKVGTFEALLSSEKDIRP
jgi:uncharacterized phiE125 gp8 family phage protein